MEFNIHHFHHFRDNSTEKEFQKKVLAILNDHTLKLNSIMALDQESLDLLIEINDSTTEIGDDITELINKPNANAEEFKNALRPIAERLKGIAATYTKDIVI